MPPRIGIVIRRAVVTGMFSDDIPAALIFLQKVKRERQR
jgi:hypothetical protein